jgi:hypothetical protein
MQKNYGSAIAKRPVSNLGVAALDALHGGI